MNLRESKIFRFIAFFLSINLLLEVIFPSLAFALTAGPNSPEFTSFTPVATSDMINVFTGDFSYNLPVIEIPGAEGGGYALSLGYNGHNSNEQESSWVGFGWSLNPGSINRNQRGFPDDFNGEPVQYYNKTRPNWTTSMTLSCGVEAFSKDIPLNFQHSLRFNNHNGFMRSRGLGISYKGIASLNVSFDPNGPSFSANVNPMAILSNMLKKKKEKTDKIIASLANNDCKHEQILTMLNQEQAKKSKSLSAAGNFSKNMSINAFGSDYGIFSYSDAVRPTSFTKYHGFSFNWSIGGQVTPSQAPVGVQIGASGNFNMQFNEYKTTKQAFGYFHTPDDPGTDKQLDYSLEKESSFDKRDLFIAIPMSNPDIFSVSGEGLGGGFRGYCNNIGQYKPSYGKSSSGIGQVGAEIGLGLHVSVGVDFGAGAQKTIIDGWNVTNPGSFASANNEILRFNNDLGGKIEYTASTDLEKGRIDITNNTIGFKNAKVEIDAPQGYSLPSQIGRSSYITNTKAASADIIVPEGVTDKDNSIAQFSIYNEQGLLYTYGQPVFTRNETNLSVDLRSGDDVKWKYLAFRDLKLSRVENGYEVKDDDLNSSRHRAVIGQIINTPYANNFLLTQITTPEYVDRGIKGPSQEDFGGWTKFDYRKIYGENSENGNKWYRYRTPYNGLLYQQNEISNTKDDMGSVVTGEKEVSYLKTIETKTHIAYFITNKTDLNSVSPYLKGSQKDRPDGMGAYPLDGGEDEAAKKPADGTPLRDENAKLEFLEKIVLFPKDKTGKALMDKPLKVVRFDYDWSLVPNLPNNINGTYDYSDQLNNVNSNSGKLTLKRVWFEYNGAVSAKISPYEFRYTYTPSAHMNTGKEFFQPYDKLTGNLQNPNYAAHLLDPWGNNMPFSKEQKEKGIDWIPQKAQLEEALYDPAAWQLKSIKLPSGGEIHIQYEAKDYTHVQDRPAMAMASLRKFEDKKDSELAEIFGYRKDPEYTINVADLGADPTNAKQVEDLAKIITAHFQEGANKDGSEEKIYFKFLYALMGNYVSLDDCRSEYITGYSNFVSAIKETISTENGDLYGIRIKLDGEDSNKGGRAPLPRKACYEFAVNKRQGKLESSDCVEQDYERRWDDKIADAADLSQRGTGEGAIKFPIAAATNIQMSVDPKIAFYENPQKNQVCKEMSPELSFLKLPMYKSKLGGGVRVKRLLMYDPGIENGDPAVYGTEYKYVLEDGVTSSGVASNEPSGAREENPLVRFLPKKGQSWFSRLTAGEDREQTEGPLGESLLPSPSVGYSRVVVQNIHSGSTGSGFTVHEFFTTKDYPFDRNYEDMLNDRKVDSHGRGVEYSNLSDQQEKDFLIIPSGLFNYSTNKVWTAQGFRFILNNMNGQNKKVASYGGEYGPATPASKSDIDQGYLVSLQEYSYYEPGEIIEMWTKDEVNGGFREYDDTPGKEMDITMESRRLKDVTIDFSIEFDVGVGIAFPPPIFVNLFPSFSHSDKLIATHATTKVISYPVINKSVLSYQDGVYNLQENLAFNASTGKPVLSRMTDGYHGLKLGASSIEHDGSIYSLSIPADWLYGGMGQKAVDETNTNQLSNVTASFVMYGQKPEKWSEWFKKPTNVLSASVQTFSKDWATNWADTKIKTDFAIADVDVTTLNKIWRPKESYIYKSDQVTTSIDHKTYKSGTYDISTLFDWTKSTQTDPGWIKTAQITKYSPHGNALEERNVLNIPSAAVFGKQYANSYPVMIAQNSEYDALYFEDYEDVSSTAKVAHSGTGSTTLSNNMLLVGSILGTALLTKSGGILKFYVNIPLTTLPNFDLRFSATGASIASAKPVTRTGEWTLYEAKIDKSVFAGKENTSLSIYLNAGSTSLANAYVDDVRFQPQEAQATCYVYDVKTMRLITQFDDQHFGLYYQYNDEGKLVRKLIETERGFKTIQETQYNMPKSLRPN